MQGAGTRRSSMPVLGLRLTRHRPSWEPRSVAFAPNAGGGRTRTSLNLAHIYHFAADGGLAASVCSTSN
jgi:hypothetical protein